MQYAPPLLLLCILHGVSVFYRLLVKPQLCMTCCCVGYYSSLNNFPAAQRQACSPLTLSAHLQVSYKLTSVLAAHLAQEWPLLRTATYRVAREWLPEVHRWLCTRLLRCDLPSWPTVTCPVVHEHPTSCGCPLL